MVQVCRLVKFMIDHCQEILEREPFSLFGGPPQRPDTAEVETGTFSESANSLFWISSWKHLILTFKPIKYRT